MNMQASLQPPSSSIIIDVKHEHARKEREMGNKVKFMSTMPCLTYLARFSAALLVAKGPARRSCHKSCRFSRKSSVGNQKTVCVALSCRNLNKKSHSRSAPEKMQKTCVKLTWCITVYDSAEVKLQFQSCTKFFLYFQQFMLWSLSRE